MPLGSVVVESDKLVDSHLIELKSKKVITFEYTSSRMISF